MHFLFSTKPQQVQTLHDLGFSQSVPFKQSKAKQKPSIFGVEEFTVQKVMGKSVLFKECPLLRKNQEVGHSFRISVRIWCKQHERLLGYVLGKKLNEKFESRS